MAVALSGSIVLEGSITGSLLGTSSYSSNAGLLNGLDSSVFALTSSLGSFTSSLNDFSSSINTYTASNNANIAALNAATASLYNATASIYLTTASLNQYTASLNTRSASFACIDSTNNFACAQYFSNASNAISFSSTGSLYSDGGMRLTKDLYVSGTSYFNNVTVFGTQSINYITSSQLNIASNLITVNTSTPAVRFGGLAVYDSGSLGTGLTGSLLWDSEANHWVYSNPSGSSYSGGMFISGPRSAALGSEQGTTACMVLVGQGGDHLTSSAIYHSTTATCIPNTLIGSIICSTMANASCIGIGTTTPSQLLHLNVASGTVYSRIQNNNNSLYLGLESGGIAQVSSDISSLKVMAASYTSFETCGAERFRISSTGVACFSCQVCAANLVLSGDINNTNASVFDINSAPSVASVLRLQRSGGTGGIEIYQGNTPTRNILIANTGELCLGTSICSPRGTFSCCLGVGIASPGYTLDVVCNGTTSNCLANILKISHVTNTTAASGLGAGILFTVQRPSSNLNINRAAIYGISGTDADDDGDLAFYTLSNTGATGFNQKMRITSDGYVAVTGNQGLACVPYLQGMSFGWNRSNGQGESMINWTNAGGGTACDLVFNFRDSSTLYERLRLSAAGTLYFGVGASSYEQVSLCYSGYNGGSPLVTLMPTTVPGSGALTTQLLLKSNGLGGGSGCNHMGLNVQSTTYLASCNGAVGIGTTNPLQALAVSGNVYVGNLSNTLNFSGGGNDRFLEIGAGSGGDAMLMTHSSGYGVGYFGYESAGDRLVIATDCGGGANKIDFILNAGTCTGGSSDNLNGISPVMRITACGNVGIGTTNLSTEANLFLGAQGTVEGGQLVLQKGTSYNCATHLDNYTNQFRILSGTDTTSTAAHMILDHTTMNACFYGITSFPQSFVFSGHDQGDMLLISNKLDSNRVNINNNVPIAAFRICKGGGAPSSASYSLIGGHMYISFNLRYASGYDTSQSIIYPFLISSAGQGGPTLYLGTPNCITGFDNSSGATSFGITLCGVSDTTATMIVCASNTQKTIEGSSSITISMVASRTAILSNEIMNLYKL